MEIIISLISVALIVSAINIVISDKLFELIISLSIFSLMISLLYLTLDAPDVAMTEVSLGCALSTVIILAFTKHLRPRQINFNHSKIFVSILIVSILCAILFYAGCELAEFGNYQTKLHENLNRYYIEHADKLIGTPSIPAAILASFRGYDTLGETTVILIAALGVVLIRSKRVRNVK